MILSSQVTELIGKNKVGKYYPFPFLKIEEEPSKPFRTHNGKVKTMPKLLTLPEACEILRIRKSALYRLINAGKIRLTKVGRRSLIAHDDLVAFLEASR